jgi:acyl dehydratase
MAQDGTKPIAERYLEDFVVGQTFSSGRARITNEEIQAFAAKFDPQPFHLDESAPREKASFGDWRRVVGTLPPSPCGFWWRAT